MPAAETVPEIIEPPTAEPEPVQTAPEPQPVLSAAIEIAKDVVGDDFIPGEAPVFNESAPAPQTTAAEPAQADEEDDSKYKWLGFKATNLDEDDGLKKGGWKKNY